MGTVFVILIFISILISLFKYIPALEEKFKNKGKAESTQEAAPAPAAVAAPVVEEASNDDELAAVIAQRSLLMKQKPVEAQTAS